MLLARSCFKYCQNCELIHVSLDALGKEIFHKYFCRIANSAALSYTSFFFEDIFIMRMVSDLGAKSASRRSRIRNAGSQILRSDAVRQS